MGQALQYASVRNILEHAADHPWRVQDIGVLALWLDDERKCRLHVWNPDAAVGDPPIHDHPYDFTSTVIVGELVNTRYVEDARGPEYVREGYTPGRESERCADTVRLLGAAEIVRAGCRYHQDARELHDSRPAPGTVTVVHFDHVVDDPSDLTVCRRPGAPWITGQARSATHDEVKRVMATALARFDAP